MGVAGALGLEMRCYGVGAVRIGMVEERIDHGRARTAPKDSGDEQKDGGAAEPGSMHWA